MADIIKRVVWLCDNFIIASEGCKVIAVACPGFRVNNDFEPAQLLFKQ